MMISRILLSLVLFLSLSSGLGAQSWVENGDRFVYSLLYMGEARYVLYEVEKDTVVAGDTCKLFSSRVIRYVGPVGGTINDFIRTDFPLGPDYFFKTKGDSVYWFDGNQFVFTFPLNPPVGYQWEVPQNLSNACNPSMPAPPDLHEVLSDGIDTLRSGQVKRQVLLQGQNNWSLGGGLTAGVAPNRSLYPLPGAACLVPGASAGLPFKLQCRYVSSTGETELYAGDADFCSDMLVHNEEPLVLGQEPIHIFPNPFYTQLFVENPNNAAWTIRIYNMLGQQLLMQQIDGTTIDVSSLPKGIHVITIEDSRTGQLLTTEKMMKL